MIQLQNVQMIRVEEVASALQGGIATQVDLGSLSGCSAGDGIQCKGQQSFPLHRAKSAL